MVASVFDVLTTEDTPMVGLREFLKRMHSNEQKGVTMTAARSALQEGAMKYGVSATSTKGGSGADADASTAS